MAATKKCSDTDAHPGHYWMWQDPATGLMSQKYCNGVRARKES